MSEQLRRSRAIKGYESLLRWGRLTHVIVERNPVSREWFDESKESFAFYQELGTVSVIGYGLKNVQ